MARIQFRKSKDSAILSASLDESGSVLTITDSNGTFFINTNDLIEDKEKMRIQGAHMPIPNKPKVEKRYIAPPNAFSMVDFTNLGVVEENTSMMPKFVIGENYALGGEKVEGFEQKYKLYNLVGMVDEFAGAKVDSLIVKQIEGEQGNIYTISKSDCDFLGIEYQNGLQLFSKNLSWRHVRDIPEFDEHNLGTSPTSVIDNSIRYLVLKLKGFTDYSDGYVLSPSGKLIKESQFTQSVQVSTKEPVVYGNGHIIQDKVPLRAYVTHPRTKLFNHGNFISSEDEVFILIELVESARYSESTTFDNKFGVDPKYFDGLDPNEYFEVSWDELGGMTVEEYEEAKRQAEKEAAERAKKEEEERKRLIAEAEKAAAEKAKLESLAVERMKKFKLREPELIEMPKFNREIDPIVGIDMYIKGVDSFFKSIDNSLEDLSRSLSNFKVNAPSLGRVSEFDNMVSARRHGMIGDDELLNFLDENFF